MWKQPFFGDSRFAFFCSGTISFFLKIVPVRDGDGGF